MGEHTDRPWKCRSVRLAGQQRGEGRQARVRLERGAIAGPYGHIASAAGAQAGAVRPAERMHRLAKHQLVAQHRYEIDLVSLVQLERLFVDGRRRERGSTLGIDARQVLLGQRDGHRLLERLQAP